MRTEWKLFFWLGVFMAPLGIAYGFVTSDKFTAAPEEAGTLLLIITAVAFFFIAAYLKGQSNRMNGLRPEDIGDATHQDSAGSVGSFPVGSIWPFVGAVGAMTMAFGLVFNGFIALPGIGAVLFSIAGMARESAESSGHGGDELDAHAVPLAPVTSEFDQAQVKK